MSFLISREIFHTLDKYKREYWNGKVSEGLRCIRGIEKHFYFFHQVRRENGDFKRYVFYQIPYSEWTKNKSFREDLEGFFKGKCNKVNEFSWKYELSDNGSGSFREMDMFNRINGILATCKDFLLPFDRLQAFYSIFPFENNDLVTEFVGDEVVENIEIKLKGILSEKKSLPEDYPKELLELEKKILYKSILYKSIQSNGSKNILLLFPLRFQKVWFGTLVIIASEDRKQIVKELIYHLKPEIELKIYKSVVEKRFIKNALIDVDAWTVDYLSRIAATMGLLGMNINDQDLSIKFSNEPNKHNSTKDSVKSGVTVLIKGKDYKVLFDVEKIPPFINLILREVQDYSEKIYKNFYYSLKSAISAIMSRNMSHNIGSHVLAYLGMENLVKLAARLIWKDPDGIRKFEEICRGLESYLQSLKDFCEAVQANGDRELEKLKKALESKKSSLEIILKDLTGDIRWGLTEWVEDTKAFLGYMQHRMDFLALISTEWPEWTFPAYLMKDIMREFLSQRHLLDGIAKSEGLRGFYYDWERGRQKYSDNKDKSGRIKFHVLNLATSIGLGDEEFVKDVWSETVEEASELDKDIIRERLRQRIEKIADERILLYSGEQSKGGINTADIQIAIPGGIIGCHAFYVILENIIRNAAKHSYAKQREESGIRDLEIVIEFTDAPGSSNGSSNEQWLFRVYDNVSSVKRGENVRGDKFRIFDKNAEGNKTSDDLVAFMNMCLGHRIIGETGDLDKRHWGMAEMKIAAGYLQKRGIEEIGGENEQIYGSPDDQEKDFIIRAIESPIGTLGFEFKLKKPKEVGIVCEVKEDG